MLIISVIHHIYRLVSITLYIMKKIALLFIFFLLSLFFVISCNQKAKQDNYASQSDFSESITAIDLHKQLMLSFGDDWMERESDSDLYPDFYGGSFIDYSGTFVIAISGEPEQYIDHLTTVLGTDNFHVEKVQYSYKQLMQVMDLVDAFLVNPAIPETHPVMTHFAGAYPDVMENRVKVLFTEVNQEVIDLFQKEISNSPIFVFEQGEIPDLF